MAFGDQNINYISTELRSFSATETKGRATLHSYLLYFLVVCPKSNQVVDNV